jgi:hypothetical protein
MPHEMGHIRHVDAVDDGALGKASSAGVTRRDGDGSDAGDFTDFAWFRCNRDKG